MHTAKSEQRLSNTGDEYRCRSSGGNANTNDGTDRNTGAHTGTLAGAGGVLHCLDERHADLYRG